MSACFSVGHWLALEISFARMRRAVLSFRHDLLNGCGGIDLVSRARHYPPESLMSPAEHVAWQEQQGSLGSGLLLTQTFRNCVQNPRCPLFTRMHGICQRGDDDVQQSRRPYYGIAFGGNGHFRALAIDFDTAVPDDVQWWAAGIPVLWNGQVVRPEQMACEVADHSHLWKLYASGSEQTTDHVAHYQQLAAIFRRHIHSPADQANRALWEKARELRLERQPDYLHNLVGVRDAEALIVIVATGALERLGQLARDVSNATHAVVVDNGGSCEVAVRRPGSGQPLIPLIHGPNFREPTLALALYELDCDNPKSRFFSTDHTLCPQN